LRIKAGSGTLGFFRPRHWKDSFFFRSEKGHADSLFWSVVLTIWSPFSIRKMETGSQLRLAIARSRFVILLHFHYN
jgi:hypothetical protein